MCVGVTLWYGCGGVVSVCRLKRYIHIDMQYRKHCNKQCTNGQQATTIVLHNLWRQSAMCYCVETYLWMTVRLLYRILTRHSEMSTIKMVLITGRWVSLHEIKYVERLRNRQEALYASKICYIGVNSSDKELSYVHSKTGTTERNADIALMIASLTTATKRDNCKQKEYYYYYYYYYY